MSIASASDIKKRFGQAEQGKPVTLPSGIVVLLRRPKLSKLIHEGKVPNHLVPSALKAAQGSSNLTAEDIKNAYAVGNTLLVNAFVQPAMVLTNPGDNEITPDMLDDSDWNAALSYITQGVEEQRPFRGESGSGDNRPDLQEVPRKKTK